MSPTRSTFLAMAAGVRPLLVAAGDRWGEPSALAEFTIGGLAAHLARAATALEEYLDATEPEGEPISAVVYYTNALGDPSVDAGVLQRGETMAADGAAAVLARFDGALTSLQERLATEPPGRKVAVFQGMVLTLDDYLATRMVELAVHADDLAVSLDTATPDLPFEAVLPTLVDIARARCGDVALLRALTRAERAGPVSAF